MIVDMIKDCLGSILSMTLVKKIKVVSRQFTTVKFQFVSRERNTVADWLTKSCPSSEVNLATNDALTFHVRKLLLKDKICDFM